MSLNLGEVMVRVGADLGPFKAAMQGAQGSTKELGAHLEKTSGAFKLLEFAAEAAAAVGLAEFTKKSLEAAMEGERTMARVKVAFGDGSKAVIAWAETMHQASGVSVDTLLNVRSQLQGFAESMTGSAKVADEMSASLAPVAMNMSKVFGVEPLQAAEALRAGIAGNGKALAEYGIAMNATALKEYAHSQGIRENIANLSEGQAAVLRYGFLLQQTARIQAGASDSSRTFSGTVFLLKESMNDLTQTVGNALTPALLPILESMRGIVAVVTEWVAHHKQLTATIVAVTLGLAGVAAAIAGITLLMAPLFAMSAPFLALMAVIAALGLAAVYFYETWKKNLYGVRDFVYSLADGFRDFFGWIATNVKGIVADFVQPWLDGINLILVALAGMGVSVAKDLLAKMPKSADELFGDVASGIDGMKKDAAGLVDDTKKAMMEMVSTLGAGFKDLGKDFSVMIDPILAKLSGIGKAAASHAPGAGGGTAAGTAAGSDIKDLYKNVAGPVRDFGAAAAAAGESLLTAIPALHGLTSAAAKGAELGGVWGAVIGVFAELLSKSAVFATLQATVTKMLQKLADALNPVADGILAIVQALAPLMDAVTQLLSGVTTDLVPVFSALAAAVGAIAIALVPLIELFGPLLAPIIRALADALTGAAIVIIATVMVIADTWNAILDVVAKVITDLAVVVGAFSKDAAKAMTEFAGTLTKSTMDTVGIDDAWKKLLNPTAAELEAKKKARADAKAADAANQFADSAQSAAKAADSLTNVPTGFKIAMARFASTMGIATPGYSGGGVPDIGSKNPGDAGGLHQTVMTGDVHVTIQTNDPDAAWKGIKKAMQRDSFLKTGAGIMSAPRLVGG